MTLPKKTNVFICHRPYHVLRSCDMVKSFSENCENILIHFNMKKMSRKDYQEHFRLPMMEKYFDRIILIEREDFFGKVYSLAFRRFYKKIVVQYSILVGSLKNVDNVYFFSDFERPVEILVGLFKKETCARINLVDEGTATYCKHKWQKHKYKVYLSEIILHLLGCNVNLRGYGQSKLYDESYALWPELAIFRKPIHKLPIISPQIIAEMYKSLSLNLSSKRVIFASSYVNVTYGVSKDFEMTLLKSIQKSCRNHGYELYIKPHPVQPLEYYNDFGEFVCASQIPIEMLLEQDVILISPFSSVLVNARAMGVKSICISKLFSTEDKYDLIPFFKRVGIHIAENELDLSRLLFNRKGE